MKAALLALTLAVSTPATAQLTQRDLASAVATPTATTRLPMSLSFTDLANRRATLAEVADGHPLVLMFADYTCRHLCAPGLVLTAGALHDSHLVAGADYRLAVIGLDPKDDAVAARRFGASLGKVPNVARATTLLRGDPATVAAAAKRLGYGFVYDAGADQFAHDASVYVFAADGHLAALLPEMALNARTMRGALTGGTGRTSFASRVAHLCYGLTALTGRFDQPVVRALQMMTALALLASGAMFLRRRRA